MDYALYGLTDSEQLDHAFKKGDSHMRMQNGNCGGGTIGGPTAAAAAAWRWCQWQEGWEDEGGIGMGLVMGEKEFGTFLRDIKMLGI
jgi:hypothetical protein